MAAKDGGRRSGSYYTVGRVSVWEDEEALAAGAGGWGVSGQLGLRGNMPFQKTNQPTKLNSGKAGWWRR